MKILNKNTATLCRAPLSRILACAVMSLLAAPAMAAPGDTPAPPRTSESNPPDRPAGSLFEYLRIAGSTFHPLDSTTSYSYPGNGCIAKTGGTDNRFVHKVILPQGAVARYMRLYYYDTSASDVVAFFTTYDGASSFNEVSQTSSSGASGFAETLTPLMNLTVDHYTSAINVVVNLGSQNNETLRFCGVRIAYDAPITDRIFANGFDPSPL